MTNLFQVINGKKEYLNPNNTNQKEAEIINTTPHIIKLQLEDRIINFPPNPNFQVRAEVIEMGVSMLGCIPISKQAFSRLEGLPDENEHCYYLVSSIVKSIAVDRNDLLVPDTGKDSVIRDEKGNIIAVKRLKA